MTDNPQGLSKNQLKKLAKQAEKAQKKAAKVGGGAAAAPAKPSTAPAKPAPPTAPPVLSSSRYTLLNPQVGNIETFQTVWAWMHFHSKDPAFMSSVTDGSNTTQLLTSTGTTFTTGHAMVTACATRSSFTDEISQDEWCEWSQTGFSIPELEAALVSTTTCGLHMGAPTKADICIVSRLHCMKLSELPSSVERYYKSYAHQLEPVEQAVQDLVENATAAATSSVDVDVTNEPRLLQVARILFVQAMNQLYDPTLVSSIVDSKKTIVQYCNKGAHDIQLTTAMPIFAALKKSGTTTARSPQDVAHQIIDAIGTNHPVLCELAVTGPGFVMANFSPTFLQSTLMTWLPTGSVPIVKSPQPLTCVVDFSSPNIAKEMHVGHLRSTIIGESVCRILEVAGNHVHRVNHVGDWGTQFGMLIQYLKEEYPDVSTDNSELPNITDLTGFYKNAKKRFDDDAEFKKTSQLNVVKLQSGDPECMAIWKLLCDVSRQAFEKVYQRLDVTNTEYGESFYNDKIPPVIEEFDKAGLLSSEEGGAKCVFVKGSQIPLMLQKSDGGYGYDSTDMAALKYRLFELKADRIMVITDFRQNDHFKMVYQAAEEIGWLKEKNQRLQHIGFGTVNGEDGKAYKTRSGDTVRLVDLLDDAVARMEASLRERLEEGKSSIDESEVHAVAEAIGYGAVKYFDLRRNPTTDYKFSYDDMLSTSGDTAVYLLYACARLQSILAKAEAEHGVKIDELLANKEKVVIADEYERSLLFHLHKFADTMEMTLDELYPYHICEYVYKLSNAASVFVKQCKVLGSPEMKSRLLLCHATIVAMDQCFGLLGIRSVKRI